MSTRADGPRPPRSTSPGTADASRSSQAGDAVPPGGVPPTGPGWRRSATNFLRQTSMAGAYPHGIHPVLVPGVSVDDQRYDYRTDKVVVALVAASILAFVTWGILDPQGMSRGSEQALVWVTTHFGWFFSGLAAIVLFFLLFIGFSRYGTIPLGLDGEQPEFSTVSWVSMLFAAGMGIGLLFFGPYEPMQYYLEPAPGTADPQTRQAMHQALVQTVFHWGPQAWAMYALVGATVAYGAYRRGRTVLMSSIFEPLIGRRGAQGLPGRLIDVFAIIATLFGTAAALGIGALQIGRGLQVVTGIGRVGNGLLIAIVAFLTVAFIASAVSGIDRGIRYLSNINMTFAVLTAFFVFVAGPSLFLANLIPSVVADYLGQTLGLIAYSASYGEKEAAFLRTWTVFYWAWWVSWSPFVGIFVAKISRGRTLREFVTVVIIVPSLVCLLSFCVYGGTSMWMQEAGRADVASAPNAQDALFVLLDALPFSEITPFVVLFMLTVFFVTSADSASLVMGSLSQRGRPHPSRGIVILLGLFLSAIAVVMLVAGGQEALTGMQNLIVVSALPFAVAMVAMMVAFALDLRTDPAVLRRAYAEKAVGLAVREGVRRYGDRFALAVAIAPEGAGAGDDIDSDTPAMTEWYQRRDEHGEPVEYDYETGRYLDEPAEDDEAEATVVQGTTDGTPLTVSTVPTGAAAAEVSTEGPTDVLPRISPDASSGTSVEESAPPPRPTTPPRDEDA